MKLIKMSFILLFILAFSFACVDEGEEIVEWKAGNELLIKGSKSLVADGTTEVTSAYTVDGYTINKSYNWTVTGPGATPASGSGEEIEVTFSESGAYTIQVDNGDEIGNIEVVVTI